MPGSRAITSGGLALAVLGALAGLAGCSPPAQGPAVVASPGADGDPFRAAISQGDEAWGAREASGRLDAALVAYRRAASLRPGDPDAELRLARAEALRAQAAEPGKDATAAWDSAARAGERALRSRSPAFAEAVDRGEEPVGAAARVEADGAEALYWLAVGRLRVAQATGPMAVMVTKDVVLGLLERAAALDGKVDRAGPDRWLGALRAALPTAAGGGVARAREHFERARALAPEDPFRPLLEAETLAVLLQDAARFDALLAEVTARDPAAEPLLAAEITAARRRAAALAARRARLF